MIDREELLAAGFKDYTNDNGREEFVTGFFQKCVRSGDGTKLYYINIKTFDFSSIGVRTSSSMSSHADARLYTDSTGTFGVDVRVCPVDVGGVQGVLDFYAKTYRALNCIPDIHNN